MLTVAVRFCPETHQQQYKHKDAESKSDDGYNVESIEVFEEPQNYIRINNEFNLYFDTVLGSNSFQSDVFSKIIRCKANDFLNGINCSILTYGAKSTGKSYTMFGKLNDRNAVSHLGIVPRTISYLIEKLQCHYNKSREDHIDWNLFVSFGCVASENISDLINIENNKHIHLKRNKKTSEYYLKNLTQIKIKKISSFLKHMHIAEEHRKKYHAKEEGLCHMFAVIKLNIYSLSKQKNGNQRSKLSSTVLNFIDCASYPSIEDDDDKINFSFIQLNALMTRIAKKSDLQIDVRESILTKLLYPIRQKKKKKGKLLVLINCKLDNDIAAETMATLRFGNLPTIDPFILSMMEKQRQKIKKLEVKSKEYKMKYRELKMKYKQEQQQNASQTSSVVAIEHSVDDDKMAHLEKEVMQIENKYELLQSEYELMKLDYAANKKELNTQKNHNFWLMEDYNELKLKLNNNNNNDDKMSDLIEEIRRLRSEKAEFDDKMKGCEIDLNEYENEMREMAQKHENELNELMIGIKERDEEIEDLREELRLKEEENIDENKRMKKDREMYEKYIKELEENALDENAINGTNYKDKNGEHQEKEDKDAEIRELKMQIIKYKTDICSSLLVEKLRHKKRKLEEKVINLRTDKAKQIVAHNQELHAYDERINEQQRRIQNMNAIRKWTKLVHKRQIVAVSKNMQRANKKMKQNYTQNSEFRDQMFLLRKIAEKKLENASAKNVNYEQLAIETTTDFEAEMIGLLPLNLKRIHKVINKLTNKLMIKNGEIHELHRKCKISNINMQNDEEEEEEDDDDDDILDNIYSSNTSEDQHTLLDDDFPSTSTKIRDAYCSNDSKAITIFDDDDEVQINEEETYLNEENNMNEENNNKHYDEKNDEYQLKQKQLRLLQDSSLSVAFHLDNAKNTRIKLNVAMTPCDVFKEMMCCSNDGDDLIKKGFSLIIQHNICPDYERIVIPSNCMQMSFWQIIVEFGILNLLHFNICCDENAQKYLHDENHDEEHKIMNVYSPKIKAKYKNRKRKDSKRGSGIWNMFAKK